MTKGEIRKARKAARTAGRKFTGELALERDDTRDREVYSETAKGYRARERWARRYDALNGAPEGDADR